MKSAAKPLTGRKVLAIAIGAFGVIVTANMALVYAAIGSFPGLEVKNTYAASQFFDTDRANQIALGWQVSATYENGELQLIMLDKTNKLLRPAYLEATIGRATHANADLTLDFRASESGYLAPVNLRPGKWELRLNAKDGEGSAFRQRISLWVSK